MADDQVRARRTSKAGGATPPKRAAKKAAPAKTAATKKAAPAKTAATKKAAPAKTAATKKAAPAKKAAAKKAAPAKTAATKKAAPAKTAATKKAAPAKKAPAKKQAAKKAAAAKRPATRRTGAVLSGTEQAERRSRLREGVSYAGDWEEAPAAPEPEPVREDPQARIRGILRAAAASIEAREAPAPSPAVAPPTEPEEPDEPVTRDLVAPVTPEDEADEVVEEEGDWLPPDVIEEEEAAAPPPSPPPPPPSPPPPPPPPPPGPPAPPEAPAAEPPAPARPVPEERKAGAGLSVVAIVLALVVPLLGAVLGLILSGRARARGAALAGMARVVSILALVAYLVGGGVFAYVTLRDEGVDYSKLKVGDCFDSTSSNEVRGVKVKSCDEPHNSEIFFLVEHPAGPGEPYPGKDTLVQFAADACLGQPLTEYLGIPLEQSSLKDFEIVPQESAWEDGRRLLVCGLDTGGEGRITGSVKGTRR